MKVPGTREAYTTTLGMSRDGLARWKHTAAPRFNKQHAAHVAVTVADRISGPVKPFCGRSRQCLAFRLLVKTGPEVGKVR